MHKKIISCLLLISMSFSLFSTNNPRYGIIPKPLMLKETFGEFKLSNHTKVIYPENNERVTEIAVDFAAQLLKTSGLSVKAIRQQQVSDQIVLRIAEGFAEEEYTLSITPQQIVVTASTPNGIFYGVQSICQLLPPQVYGEKKVSSAKWVVPCCEIRDAPRFSYRGLMLDCGRYFMPKETVMKFIDVMAMHKQNMFHWHLTEDQGWRIEIKKYPRLTEIGSMRKETTGYSKDGGDGKPHGGFYTQEEVKEVVEYARKRCVTVIPEIELPGHSSAAIAAYPELSCFPDRKYEVATSWGVKKDVFCPTATTFRFLENVFTELFDLFPSPYYHIGGDECPRDIWKESDDVQNLKEILGVEGEDQIQIFFVQRMSKFLKEKGGKSVIGWDEIQDGGAVQGTIVMSYRGHAPAMRASRQGLRTILTPNRWNYLDYYQEDPEKEEKSQGLFLPLEKVYNYFPIPDTMPKERQKFVIGQQGSLWTEFVATPQRAEYKAFPRAVAMSEVAWCDKPDKDWGSFCQRMLKGFERLDQKEVNYSRAFWNVIFGFNRNAPFPKNIGLTIDYPDAKIHYTLNGKEPTTGAAVYSDSIMVSKGDIIRAQGFLSNGKKLGVPVEKRF